MASNVSLQVDTTHEKNIPVMVMLAVFVVIGICGNSLILYIYWFRFKVSTTRVFILSLGIFDLVTCVLLPYKIVLLRYGFLFTNPHLARLEMVRIYFLQVSVMILPLVAVDRFRRICRPFKKQISPRFAKILILVVGIIMALMIILRMVVSSDSEETGKQYRAEALISPKYVNTIFSGTFLSVFYFVCTAIPFCLPLPIMMILYFLIALKVRTLVNGDPLPRLESPRDDMSTEDMILNTDKSTVKHTSTSNHGGDPSDTEVTATRTKWMEGKIELKTKTSPKEHALPDVAGADHDTSTTGPSSKTEDTVDRTTGDVTLNANRPFESTKRWKRMTLIFFLITIVYVVSIIPFLVIFFIFRADSSFGNELLSQGAFIVLYNSPYITNVSNCFLYGFFDPRFRRELKSTWRSVSNYCAI